MRKFLIIVLLFFVVGCTDAFKANLSSYGKKQHIRMYSGGNLIAYWYSTGRVQTINNSCGWQFMDSKTGESVKISGDVRIEAVE